jgi:hypothetical protein
MRNDEGGDLYQAGGEPSFGLEALPESPLVEGKTEPVQHTSRQIDSAARPKDQS